MGQTSAASSMLSSFGPDERFDCVRRQSVYLVMFMATHGVLCQAPHAISLMNGEPGDLFVAMHDWSMPPHDAASAFMTLNYGAQWHMF